MKKYKYHYVYKITNDFDNRYYIGKHSTNNLEDGYLGSGKIIVKLVKKYGKEHFNKTILKMFNTSLEAFKYEEKIVNESLLNDINCINLKKGGLGWCFEDENFSYKMSISKRNTVVVKDKNNNYFRVKCDDPRIKTGEVVYANKGLKRSEELKKKLSEIHKKMPVSENRINGWKKAALSRKNKPHKLSENGKLKILESNKRPKSQELKNKLSNKIHICKFYNNEQLHKFIDKEELNNYLINGWKRGMYAIHRIYIHKNDNNKIQVKRIPETEINKYINNGWKKGRGICTFNICDETGHMKLSEKEKHKNRCHIYKYENNELKSKLIKKDELNKYLNNGWLLGRKLKSRIAQCSR